MQIKRLALLASPLALTLLLTARAASQAAPEKEEAPSRPPETLTNVYDIRDLLIQRREYPSDSALVPPTRIGERRTPAVGTPRPGDGAGQPTSRPSAEVGLAPTRQQMVEDWTTLIKETVDPDGWRDNGGSYGAIRELQGQLIVTNSEENHRQIVNLLTQLRRTSARLVTVRAHWAFLSAADLATVVKPLEEDPALFEVDLAALEKLEGEPVQLRGQITCLNTQTVHIASGRARTVVTEQVPVVGADAIGYEPHGSVVQAGAMLEVTPVLTPDSRDVVLDVQSVVSEWGPDVQAGPPAGAARAATRPAATALAGVGHSAPEIDRVEIGVQQMRMSLVLPTGRPILVGGMTHEPGAVPRAGARQLYLILEVTGSPQTD